jgi:hypothetical protein
MVDDRRMAAARCATAGKERLGFPWIGVERKVVPARMEAAGRSRLMVEGMDGGKDGGGRDGRRQVLVGLEVAGDDGGARCLGLDG